MRRSGPLVIALDGSRHSVQTLDWGLAEAQLRHAEVVLARAYQEPREIKLWSWYPFLENLRFDDEARDYLTEHLAVARSGRPDLTISSRLLHGPDVPELRALSADAQLMVVGARGLAGRSPIGSVSAHLAAHALCPVAVVHTLTDDRTAPVVVGVDGSDSSLAAARVAAGEAMLRSVPLVVAHVRPTIRTGSFRGALPPLSAADGTDPTRRGAEKVVTDLRAGDPGLSVRLELLDGDPAHSLVQMSRRAGLVVVGSRGRGAFRGMLLGTVSNEVIRDAVGTVLVVPTPSVG